MRPDSELLDWLAKKTEQAMVYIKGIGWIKLDRNSINEAMDEEYD